MNEDEIKDIFLIKAYVEAGSVQNIEIKYNNDKLKDLLINNFESLITIVSGENQKPLLELSQEEQDDILQGIKEKLPLIKISSIDQ